VKTIGFAPEADYVIETEPGAGCQHVTVHAGGEALVGFDLAMPGEHMACNAAVAAVLAVHLDADPRKVGDALSGFRGLDRRMDYLGEAGGVHVVDDYGHHPTEIATTLRALRRRFLASKPGDGRDSAPKLICVFQPHQHSRTRFLLDQFASSFGEADVVIVPHIYFVRDSEEDKRAVSAADLVVKLRARGVDAEHIDAFEDIVARLHQTAAPGDLVVVMGAGPVWQVAHRFVGRV
jgi:UDP-N-acetylmuramate--alanine ligase